MPKSQHWKFLEDPDVKRWYDNLQRGSPITAKERLRRLGLLHKEFNVHPKDLAQMSATEARNWTLDIVTALESKGMKANYIDNHFKPVKSWFEHNNIFIQGKIRISGRGHNR